MKTLFMSTYKDLLILILILCSGSTMLYGQSDTISLPEQFLFPEFSPGVVKMKNGDKIVLNLNYNIVTERIVFMQKKQIYDMTNYGSVDTVYMNQRKFIPYGKVFYEVLVNGPVSLFIQHKGIVRQPPRPAAYGGTTELSSTRYINNIRLGNDVFRMSSGEKLIIDPKPVLWMGKDDNLYSVVNKKQILKILPDKRQELKEFIRSNHTDPADPEKIINLVNYYNGL